MPLTTNAYLYLSGTPFRALNNGEFMEYQIFNWTYSDEQKAKANWKDEDAEKDKIIGAWNTKVTREELFNIDEK